MKDVTAYQGKMPVLHNVSFSIGKNEFVYLVGRTGSGKSSILKILYGDLRHSSGDVQIAGFDMNRISFKQLPYLRRKLGIVFQDFQLLQDRTVNENLRFVLKATGWSSNQAIEKRISEVLEHVGMKSKGYKMPFELSGGEQQRVAIARALLNNPEIILADEPTGNLDPETSDGIIRLLMSVSEQSGTSVLVASHDYLVIQKFPARQLICEAGRVSEKAIATMQ